MTRGRAIEGTSAGWKPWLPLASFGAMLIRFAFALSLLLAAPAAAQTAPPAPAPAEDLVKVALDTSAGRIVLALDRGHAPITTKNFLAMSMPAASTARASTGR